MARIPLGQPLRLSTTVKDPAGVLTDPGAISLIILKPDLTQQTLTTATTPQVVRDGPGLFHLDYTPATVGPYRYYWLTTGNAAGTTKTAGFNVTDPFVPAHISFDDVKARLNITAASDDELQDMIASAVSEQEQRVGAVAPRTVVETVYPSCGRLWLSTRPVLSVTSATYNGSNVATVGSWTVGLPMAGDVAWPSGGGFYGATPYVVTYVAGRSPVPQDLVEAALLRVQASYETQRSPAGLPVSGIEDGATSTAYPLILRAQDKEAPYVLPSVA